MIDAIIFALPQLEYARLYTQSTSHQMCQLMTGIAILYQGQHHKYACFLAIQNMHE